MIVREGMAQDVLNQIDSLKAEWNRANVHFLLG